MELIKPGDVIESDDLKKVVEQPQEPPKKLTAEFKNRTCTIFLDLEALSYNGNDYHLVRGFVENMLDQCMIQIAQLHNQREDMKRAVTAEQNKSGMRKFVEKITRH